MNLRSNRFLVFLVAVVVAQPLLAADEPAAKPTPEQLDFFEKKIRPVLVKQCYECHSANSKIVQGGLLLDSHEGLKRGGDSGPAMVPGKADGSLLLAALRYDSFEMPPAGKLPDAVIADFEKWIAMGAPDPRTGPAPTIRKETVDYEAGAKFWAFRPPVQAELPAVKQTAWPQNDMDRFVLARLEQAGLSPVAKAERGTLLRRAYFNLVGLPPTPAEVEAFLADQSPDAFEKVIDRLLASEHYGERWARHWMDVARYAEDQAHTFQARRYPHGWRYRDWLVRSLNEDLPYDQFIQQQIAADLLPGDDLKDRIAALGLFALGPVYYQANQEKAKAQADELDDRIDTLCRGVLGLTVSCARCHNHKFDPISMHDYYGLTGIFASSKYQEFPLASAEEQAKKTEADEAVKAQDKLLKEFLDEQHRQLEEAASQEIAPYVVAAWKLHNRRKADPKTGSAVVAKQDKLNASLVDRWLSFLLSTNEYQQPYLAGWHALLRAQQQSGDLSGDANAVKQAEQVAKELAAVVTEATAKRAALKKKFGDSVRLAAGPAAPQKALPGEYPLGNLFDDSPQSALDAAIASDKYKAEASADSLGVERVLAGWGTVAEIAPGVQFDFAKLGSSGAKYSGVTNDGWSNAGPIGTRGEKLSGSDRQEQGIGMHANALVTFDLDEIRAAGNLPKDQAFRFIAERAGLNDDTFGADANIHVAVIVSRAADAPQGAILSLDINGLSIPPVAEKQGDQTIHVPTSVPTSLSANGRFARFDIAAPADAKYLTLVATGADDATINSDHAVFSGARLRLDPLPGGKPMEMAELPPRDDKAQAVLVSQLFADDGVLSVPRKTVEKLLDGEAKQQYAESKKELDELKKAAAAIQLPVAHALAEGTGADLKIHLAGDPERLGEVAPRGFLRVIAGEDSASFAESSAGSGRLELAQAVTARDNPLTARVIVNRVWHHHFGRGLVGTLSNFGELGERPTHPELLDYLAVRFMESGWSLKQLHREILLSATWQLASSIDEKNYGQDPDNRLLWRMNRRRLEVEPWRDAILSVAGVLDESLGGPSSANSLRRTLYLQVSRHELNELLRLFDFPDPNITAGARTVTTVPQQQLFVLNSEFMIIQARSLAARLKKDQPDDAARLRQAYLLLYAREPSEAETRLGTAFLSAAGKGEEASGDLSGWEQLCLVLMGANEFIFVD